MSNPYLRHVYPRLEANRHCFKGGANCYCEPTIEAHGTVDGWPVRVFIHQRLRDKLKGATKKKKR